MIQAYLHASEILTGKGIRAKDGRKVGEADLGVIPDGAIVFDTQPAKKKGPSRRILWLGPTSELPKRYVRVKSQNLKNKRAIMPGLVDCHTHLVFGGDRSKEFALRCSGASYEEIARSGGGILTTVNATRSASEKELLLLAVERLQSAIDFGVRTIEIKTGYGLDLESELKCLNVIRQLQEKFPEIQIHPTFLGAHAFPPDQKRSEYLKTLKQKMLPAVVDQGVATACDVFVDRGYYSISEGKDLLIEARKAGLKIKLHGDELANTESAALGADLNALSVDHLLKVSERGIQKLANSNTVAVLLPGTAFYLKEKYAPARRLIDAGACVAISTDFNPGSSMCNSLPVMMTLAALYMGMSRAEIFASVTYNAQKALGNHQHYGYLSENGVDPFIVLPFRYFEQMYYEFGWSASSSKAKTNVKIK